jgi:hypothetical protein
MFGGFAPPAIFHGTMKTGKAKTRSDLQPLTVRGTTNRAVIITKRHGAGGGRVISKSVCEQLWHCHREIEAGEKLLADVSELAEQNRLARSANEHPKGIKDVFGRDQFLQLGIPSGKDSHRLFQVSFDMAAPIIRTHIANKKAQLAELNEIARIEAIDPSREEQLCATARGVGE